MSSKPVVPPLKLGKAFQIGSNDAGPSYAEVSQSEWHSGDTRPLTPDSDDVQEAYARDLRFLENEVEVIPAWPSMGLFDPCDLEAPEEFEFLEIFT
eukprot:TRINITY_DN65305_c0_g1_i1.p1 TRINITY_DN65305_c0_g1~~TRINITY_DN65305_c0_g1_i1.p1  ORF type:complete len:108 (+),score=14.86 TRINITY_DN65305_c0_g1_i1:37-324(+)